MATDTCHLFHPISVGQLRLNHRVVLAPLTRVRADKKHVPSLPIMKEYYSQRGSTQGTLLIAEGTLIAPQAGGMKHTPGIYNQEQVNAWKQMVEGVHQKGSYIFSQLWAVGRQAAVSHLKEDDPSFSVVGPSPIPINGEGIPLNGEGETVPRELGISEIKDYIQLYAAAARKAIHEAGFDGVEVHAANGYLIDQFLQDVSNQRQDEYGGSIERRSRFGLEVVRATVDAVGSAQKVGVRLSPWSKFGDMGMKDPIPQFSHFVTALKQEYPDLAYIHVVEPGITGGQDLADSKPPHLASNDFLREIWSPRPYISAGGYVRENAMLRADERENELVAFGRLFIANPDLPLRLKKNIPLNPYNRATFYLVGDTTGKGYTDYPFASESALERPPSGVSLH